MLGTPFLFPSPFMKYDADIMLSNSTISPVPMSSVELAGFYADKYSQEAKVPMIE